MPYSRQSPDELEASLLDAFLNGQSLPADTPAQLRVVAEMLASLAGPAGQGELAGEAAARVAFARAASRAATSPATQRLSRRPRPSWLRAPVSARLAAGLVAAAIGVGGAAAAYADVLPDPIQDLAHYLLHAPSPRPAIRQQQQHPADHKLNARPHPSKPGTAVGKGNSKHRRKAHYRRRHHHPIASHHLTANHHKARHPGARTHSGANGHVTGKHPAKP